MFWVGLLVGLWIGGAVGVVTMGRPIGDKDHREDGMGDQVVDTISLGSCRIDEDGNVIWEEMASPTAARLEAIEAQMAALQQSVDELTALVKAGLTPEQMLRSGVRGGRRTARSG